MNNKLVIEILGRPHSVDLSLLEDREDLEIMVVFHDGTANNHTPRVEVWDDVSGIVGPTVVNEFFSKSSEQLQEV